MSNTTRRTRREEKEGIGLALASSLFTVTAIWIVSDLRKRRRRGQQGQGQHNSPSSVFPYHSNSLLSSSSSASLTPEQIQDNVSSRAIAALKPTLPYLHYFLTCLENNCHAVTNRSGYIALCVAENKLMSDFLSAKFPTVCHTAFSEPATFQYNSFLGMPVARQAAAYFLAQWFYYDTFQQMNVIPLEQALQVIQPSNVVISAGATPLIHQLSFALCNGTGDCCLIPAPYYAAFESDMGMISHVIPFPVVQDNPQAGPTVTELNTAYAQAIAQGYTPKVLLLTNPHNPLATIYRPSLLLECVTWARSKRLHTIVDEVYALSTHHVHQHHHNHKSTTQPPQFQSIVRILNNQLHSDVHMLWAFSKDMAGSGIRFAVLYTQNQTLLKTLANTNVMSAVSGPMQYMIAELLTDTAWMSSFLQTSRQRILKSYTICTRKLDEMVIPYLPAQAAIYVYVDFSSLLPAKTFEYEQKLTELFFKARVVLTPGSSQRERRPGMFRICYAWVDVHVLEIAMERLSRLVAKLRRMDWDDIMNDTRIMEQILQA